MKKATNAFFRQHCTALDVITLTLPALGVMVAALLCAQFLMVRSDSLALEAYSEKLFERGLEIVSATNQTLDLATTKGEPCSDRDLRSLRQITVHLDLLKDVGRVAGNKLLCSVIWGRQSDSIPDLPEPALVLGSTRLWSAIPNPANPEVINDLAARGNTIVMTSPNAFAGFEPPPDSRITARITSRRANIVFVAFGVIGEEPPAAERWHGLGATRHFLRCDADFLLCVESWQQGSGLSAQPPAVTIGLALLGLLAGAALGLLLVLRRRHQHSLPMQLRRAIEANALVLHYQPLRRLADGHLVGAEALARWRDESGTGIPPDVFLRIADDLGMMPAITRQIVRKSLEEMRPLLTGAEPFYLAMNVTVEDLLDRSFHRYLDAEVKSRHIAPGRIVLEINEKSTTESSELPRCIHWLKEAGYQLYIDDFGTGHSNIARLASLPIDAIKVDKMFVQAIGSDSPIAAILKPVCDLARQLGVQLVVEGVERQEEADYIHELDGTAVGQGWLLGKPMPAGKFIRNAGPPTRSEGPAT